VLKKYFGGIMMRFTPFYIFTIVLFVFVSFFFVPVGASQTMWNYTYGGEEGSIREANSLVETSDGGYAFAGLAYNDFWLVKTDFNGNMLWNKTYGGKYGGIYEEYGIIEAEIAHSLVESSDGGYALVGDIPSNKTEFDTDFWLVKTDANGNMEWNQTYGGNWTEHVFSLVHTGDGGYAIVGETISFGAGDFDFWLVKTDAYGNMEWNQTYGGTRSETAFSLIETSDGGYAIGGYTYSVDTESPDFWLIKTDAYGNMEWNQTYGGSEEEIAFSLVETSDGGFALAGKKFDYIRVEENDSLTFKGDFWLVKTDFNGNMLWNKTYGADEYEVASSLVTTSDGGYALCGIKKLETSQYSPSDFWLVKTDAYGNMEWNQTYGGTEFDRASSLVATSDGGFAIVGDIVSHERGHMDRIPHHPSYFFGEAWLVKTDEFGYTPKAPIYDAYEELFNQLSHETSNKMNTAQFVDYKSSDAQSLIQQASIEFNFGYSLAKQGQWQGAVTHLQNVSSLIDQAVIEEQLFQEQQENERIQQSQFNDLITMITIISAIAIIIGLFVYVMKRNRRKIEEE
jgi:hypothetical protein